MSHPRQRRGALSPVVQVLILAIVAVVAILALVLVPVLVNRFGRTHAVAQATPQPLPSGYFQPTHEQFEGLQFARVRPIDFASVTDTEGTIAPADDATTQVFSPFTGRITRVYPTIGDVVSAGAPLVEIDASEYAQAQNDLATAQRTLDSARVALDVTQRNRARLLRLLRAGGAARKDVEQSASDVAAARTAVQNDEIAVALVRSRFSILGQGAPASTAGVASKGALATSVVVRAPVSGTVIQRAAGVGQNVESAAAGASTPLMTISDFSRVFFVANVRETDAASVRVGAPVEVRMPAFPDRVFDANVTYIAPTIDSGTHRLFVRAEVANPTGALRPGMSGSFRIATAGSSRALGVPETALVYEGETARLWVAGPHETLALRNVTVGKTVDGMVEVLRGVRDGERVVTAGSVFIDRAALGGD